MHVGTSFCYYLFFANVWPTPLDNGNATFFGLKNFDVKLNEAFIALNSEVYKETLARNLLRGSDGLT